MTEGATQVTDEVIDAAVTAGAADATSNEKRSAIRHPFNQLVALALIVHNQPPSLQVVRAADISISGIGVTSRHMMHPGSIGAIHMLKSDGSSALLGVQVRHSRYLGDAGHRTGLLFTAVPVGIDASVFVDRHGRSVLMDPALRRRVASE